jgi:hypothetical protein
MNLHHQFQTIYPDFSLFFSLLILVLFLFQLSLIILLNIKNLSIDLLIDQKYKKVKFSLIGLFVIFILGIFVWRIYNRHRSIKVPTIDTEAFKELVIKIMVQYDLSIMDLLMISMVPLVIWLILWLVFINVIIYVKGNIYKQHIYLLKYKNYEKMYTKILQLRVFVLQKVLRFKIKHGQRENRVIKWCVHVISYYHVWLEFLLNRIIYWLPLYLLIYDIRITGEISKFYYCMPWIYLLIILRMIKKIQYSVHGKDRDDVSDVMKMLALYKNQGEYTIYRMRCIDGKVYNYK